MTTKSLPTLETVRSETLLFHPPVYDVSVESTCVQEYFPQSSLSDPTSPITFVVNGSDNTYINPRETKLYLRCKVVKDDGTNLTAVSDATKAASNYSTTNNLLNSIFERVSVYLNDTEITSKTNNLNPYRSYFENLLSYSKNYKKSQLEAAGFFNVDDEASADDKGWKKRYDMIAASKTFELMGSLHADVFKFDKLLLPTVDMRLVLERSANKFSLESIGTAAVDIKLVIIEAKLIVMKHTLLPSAHIAHLKTWQDAPAIYPYRQSVIKTYSLPTGTSVDNNEHLLSGYLPSRVIIGIIDTANFTGAFDKNPFNFQHNGLTKIKLTVNSDKTLEQGFDLDVPKHKWLQSYCNLFAGLGCSHTDPSIDISMHQFKDGKFLHIFDLNHSLNDGSFNLPKHGTINIHLQFKSASNKSLTVVVYAEYGMCVNIYNDRSIDFTDNVV